MASRRHDRLVLDALDAMEAEAFTGDVWRVTVEDRDPLRGSAAEGRWSPADEFEVLYTSLEREGALTEIGFRLSIEPVWPSRLRHRLHRIAARTERALRFPEIASLAPLGIDPARYSSFDYGATQSIAAAAHFLGFDSLIVPSARSPASHLVIFLDAVLDQGALSVLDSEQVDWDAWRLTRRR